MRETRTHRDPLRGLLVTVRGQSEQNWETCCLEFSWGMWDSHCYIPTRYSTVLHLCDLVWPRCVCLYLKVALAS